MIQSFLTKSQNIEEKYQINDKMTLISVLKSFI